MAYLAKSTVLEAYKLLSNIDSEKQQGLTQKVSALKYASALDLYYKNYNKNCDLKISSNRDLFSSYVGEIVMINDDYCTKDFYLSVSLNGRDFDCGSNFYSQSSVKDSKTNPNNTFLYPKRSGWKPVMDIKNQVLIYRPDYFHDAFSYYLGSSELRLAYIVWLLRFERIDEENFNGLLTALKNNFSVTFCNALYIQAIQFVDTSYIKFEDKECQLNEDDITSIFSVNKTTLTYKPTIRLNDSFDINPIVDGILSTGLIYSPTLIKRLAFSLMAKPFVILSGLAGSGKTQLALAFAKCLSENIEEQVCTVSIGADWTNREPLLGYPNALKSGEYVLPESGVLQLLMRANEDQSKPYFLILDEMNLSVVERYFADFLSAMESGEPIKLWDGNEEIPAEIKLPKNVFIIGTINVDETTYMFSPKVLDRANVIEFKIAPDEMDDYLGKKVNINLEKAYSACANMAVDFVNKANTQVEKDEKNKDVLLSFFKELKKVNAEFGYRTVNEINRYLHFADGDLEDNSAIDTAILQKLLPKLHGSRKKLVPTLTALWDICLNDGNTTKIDTETEKLNFQEGFKYPESAEKIKRMYDAVIDNGFTSFAEA